MNTRHLYLNAGLTVQYSRPLDISDAILDAIFFITLLKHCKSGRIPVQSVVLGQALQHRTFNIWIHLTNCKWELSGIQVPSVSIGNAVFDVILTIVLIL